MTELDKFEKEILAITAVVILLGIAAIVLIEATGGDSSWYVPVKCLEEK